MERIWDMQEEVDVGTFKLKLEVDRKKKMRYNTRWNIRTYDDDEKKSVNTL